MRNTQGAVMTLCGQISIELVVGDFVEAADHQRRIEALMAHIQQVYPQATLNMRERRERRALGLAAAPHRAAALTAYREA
ncbi:MAG: hypothetical protein JSR98_16970 [Proteobacteria bacterium]|nr:hypothetical protein [Pseudomonadota bacterium]